LKMSSQSPMMSTALVVVRSDAKPMPANNAGALDLLAHMMMGVSEKYERHGLPEDEPSLSVSQFFDIDKGVGAEIILPTGDKYVVVIKWSGDRESEA